MNYKIKFSVATLLLLVMVCASSKNQVFASTVNDEDPLIIVSMGDSYSSGEGIEPFYGQELAVSEKVTCEDWLAHRSTKSWPSLLTLPELNGTLADYKDVNWFFVASSGATTANILSESQEKTYSKSNISGTYEISPQIEIFDQFEQDTVDYVTITIGGNDMGFAEIIESATILRGLVAVTSAVSATKDVTGGLETLSAFGAAFCEYLSVNKLEIKFEKIWANFTNVQADICEVYETIAKKAGTNAVIIVAGYPTLISEDGAWTGILISPKHANLINKSVSDFNDKLEAIVKGYSDCGLNICFVSVEEAFEGHEAYTEEAYLNNIILRAQEQELDDSVVASAYSIHPNETGAQVYAACVQAKIDELEAAKAQKLAEEEAAALSEEIAALSVLHFDGKVDSADEVVLKFIDAVSDGDYETALSCYSPTIEKQIHVLGDFTASIWNVISGANTDWSDMVFGSSAGTNYEVVECYVISEETNYGIEFLDTWLPRIPGLNILSGTDAEVCVKYRYYDDGLYKLIEETCNVHRYTGYGWRICL